jgi:hypothetical protein
LRIESCKTQNPFILKIVEIYKSLVAIDKHVIFTWIPSHIGIHGNTVVDHEAKNALDYTDFKPLIMKYILKRWQDSWDQQIARNTFPSWQYSLFLRSKSERQVAFSRCRIGHSRLTHSYLLNNEERPECILRGCF